MSNQAVKFQISGGKSFIQVLPKGQTVGEIIEILKTKKGLNGDVIMKFGDFEMDNNDNFDDLYDKDIIYQIEASTGPIPIPAPVPRVAITPGSNSWIVFTSLNYISMTQGHQIPINVNWGQSEASECIRNMMRAMSIIDTEYQVSIYLPGGIPFKSGTINEFMTQVKPIKNHLYAIITKSISNHALNEKIVEVCDTRDNRKYLLSPNVDSKQSGLEKLACLLGALSHKCDKASDFAKSISNTTRFAPMINSLERLMKKQELTGQQLLEICGPLWTVLRHVCPSMILDSDLLDSCLKLCAIISTKGGDSTLTKVEEYDSSSTDNLHQYLKNHSPPSSIVYFKPDIETSDSVLIPLSPFKIENVNTIWDSSKAFKPVAPLSLRSTHQSCITYGYNSSVRLFVMETESKERSTTEKIELLNPKDGQTKSKDIESYSKKIGLTDDSSDPILIDSDSVSQIIMVLFDTSGSMGTKFSSSDPNTSRNLLSKQYLSSFSEKAFAYRVSSIQGLITFGSSMVRQSSLSPLVLDFEKKALNITVDGYTILWDSIETAISDLLECKVQKDGKKVYPNAQLRIVVISDGEDNRSKNKPWDIATKLLQNRVILDAIIVSLTDECKDLATVAHISGGLAFRPSTAKEGIALFEQEAFLSIEHRDFSVSNPITITSELFSQAKSVLAFDHHAPNKLVNMAKKRHTLCDTKKTLYQLNGSRDELNKRLMKELRIAYHWEDQDVKVFPYKDLVDQWRVFIKGPDGTPYESKWWYLFVKFPKSYPVSPPVLRFISVPYHINISSEGRICMNTLTKDYSSTTTVMDLVSHVKGLLLMPNFEDPIDISKMDTYKDSKDEYLRLARQSTSENGKSDYNDFLNEMIVECDTPREFEIPKEQYISEHLRDPITGSPIDPKNSYKASSGVIYDRNELKRYLSSHPNPKCIRTGKRLTEKVSDL